MSDPSREKPVTDPVIRELSELLPIVADQLADAAQLARLNELLLDNPAAQCFYLEYLDLHATLGDPAGALLTQHAAPADLEPTTPDVLGEVIDEAIRARERHAAEEREAMQLERLREQARADRMALAVKKKDAPPRLIIIPTWLAVGAVAAVAAVILLMVVPLFMGQGADSGLVAEESPQPPGMMVEPEAGPALPPIVAELTRSVGVVWSDGRLPLGWGSPLRAGEAELLEGLAEITFTDGTVLLVQAPASINLTTGHSVELSRGSLTGYCPPQAQGFTVRTPSAAIVDLGTEFGVAVDERGDTEATVFTGKVLASPIDPQTGQASDSIELTRGQTAAVDGASSLISLLDEPKVAYTRTMTREIDVLDLVAGGDGHGRQRGRGIDPSTGETVEVFKHQDAIQPAVEARFIPTDFSRYIDGVFVANGPTGPHALLQIDSTGNPAHGLKETGRRFKGPIWAMPAQGHPAQPAVGRPEEQWISLVEDWSPFTPEGLGVLVMHNNAGVTFDLQAIREDNPGWVPAEFTGLAGNAEIYNGTNPHVNEGNPSRRVIASDIYVFVDGRQRWAELEINSMHGQRAVHVDLEPGDRFLTIITTDGSAAYFGYGWTVVGDPVIHLQAGPSLP